VADAGARARLGSPLQYGNFTRRGISRQDRIDQSADFDRLRGLCGSGAKPGAKPRHCPTCGGHGRVRAQQGFFAIERTCPIAMGAAKSSTTHANPAAVRAVSQSSAASPSIFRQASRTERGSVLAAKARPEQKVVQPAILHFVSTKPHPFFQREGADLFCACQSQWSRRRSAPK